MACYTSDECLNDYDLFDFSLEEAFTQLHNLPPLMQGTETQTDDLGFPFDFDERDLLAALDGPKQVKVEPITEVVKKQGGLKRKLEDDDDMSLKTKQKRTKWADEEVQILWEGIARYGNNWRLIKKKSFSHRTYYQVKDKGRRILSSQGWTSGRTKATHDGASEGAKGLAKKVLAKADYEDKESVSKTSVTSRVGSTGSLFRTGSDFDFDVSFETN